VTQLAITFRDRSLDWYMSLDVNNQQGASKIVVEVKKLLVNEFYNPSSQDQYMNEMIDIRKKLGDYV
jgi:hypothetical protein